MDTVNPRKKNPKGAFLRNELASYRSPSVGGRCAPPNLPTETKTRTFLMRVGVGLAVMAVHELSWPYQQENRNTPSRPSNEAGQGSRP